ncbi:Glycosyltransferase, GT2 family [Desulforamulus putei DSM 12395]|uniref:Glycosyltransferase, GT2 family n=1 Tax=Desulforamulus putei DSM 12395 TaxID=1121429 RepID=A0A1M4ZSM8_9FIRM|nr:glycosyltransferase [Desulforamulus putei]SHF20807.1 Glycosyltransferase, GT2 family [Desulforamulus putei DSM 12395]
MPQVSIVIPCKNEGRFIKQTIESILDTPGRVPYDITVVNDGSTDGCCTFLQTRQKIYSRVKLINTTGIGAANARNLGARHSSGEVLVFCDAHITVEEDWLDLLAEDLGEEGIGAVSPGIANMNQVHAIGYGLTWNEAMEARWLPCPVGMAEVPFAPGGCVAVKRDVFNNVEGFERGFRIYGFEDAEFSLKLWLFGYRVLVDPGVVIKHYFRESQPYAITMEEYAYNALRVALSHFTPPAGGKGYEHVFPPEKLWPTGIRNPL